MAFGAAGWIISIAVLALVVGGITVSVVLPVLGVRPGVQKPPPVPTLLGTRAASALSLSLTRLFHASSNNRRDDSALFPGFDDEPGARRGGNCDVVAKHEQCEHHTRCCCRIVFCLITLLLSIGRRCSGLDAGAAVQCERHAAVLFCPCVRYGQRHDAVGLPESRITIRAAVLTNERAIPTTGPRKMREKQK
jgi:hypothetical protein